VFGLESRHPRTSKGRSVKRASLLAALCMAFAFLAARSFPGYCQEGTVRAMVGILVKSGDKTARAMSEDRIKAGDRLRIYVRPEAISFVYVIHTNQKSVTLLNPGEQKVQSSTLVLPSSQKFYDVDGLSSVESFTIICSHDEVKEVSALFSSRVSREKWASLERNLIRKGEMELSQRTEKPFAIAGNVRGASETGDPFMNQLQVFTGKGILVKKYEFSIKK
jgi:hypothetical protein